MFDITYLRRYLADPENPVIPTEIEFESEFESEVENVKSVQE